MSIREALILFIYFVMFVKKYLFHNVAYNNLELTRVAVDLVLRHILEKNRGNDAKTSMFIS